MYHVFIFFREREEGRDMEFNETDSGATPP